MKSAVGIIFVSIWLTAVGAWFVAAYSQMRLLGHIRPRHWAGALFWLGLWMFSIAEEHVTPEGLPHLRRLRRSLLVFVGIVLGAFLCVGVVYVLRFGLNLPG